MNEPLSSAPRLDASGVSFSHAESGGCECAGGCGQCGTEGGLDGLDEGLADHGDACWKILVRRAILYSSLKLGDHRSDGGFD